MDQLTYLLMQLAGRWGAGLAGWAIFSAIVWYVFPVVPALDPPAVRFAAIAAGLALYLLVNGALSLRNRRRRRALAAGVAGDPEARRAAEEQAEAAEEVAELRKRMREALARLKKKGWRGRQIYDQPWFVLIGPPGSGKTTALLNSGLHLPLGDDGPSARGVGGTRLCDWWFTDEAVLIDTAGRYTTQDSTAAVDAAGWTGFLDLLRRTRPRQPVNGVLVVLSIPDIAAGSAAERAAHAKAVRLRLNEITERLRLRIPVYVVLSKADQLRGFDSYFDDLDATGRTQVWGATFPLDKGVEAFAPEFRLLVGRLEERLVERLQAERAAERRAVMGQFPLQVASLAEPLGEFLRLAFSGSRLDPAPFLRGVYMTSATQQGTPIDRLTGMLARAFGVDQARAPALRPVSGRSYFVTRLIREVIFGEALLVTRRAGRWRRRQILRAAGFAAVALGFAGGGVAIWQADAANRVAVEQADEALAAYRQRLGAIKLDPVADDDLGHTASVLDAAAGLPRDGRGSLAGRLLGLSQGDKLAQADRLTYRHALERILLPRLVWRLEQVMRASFGNPAALYDATRVYLMLGGQGPLEADAVRAWEKADWEARFPGALDAPLRASLATHLDALLAEPLPPISLDGALVEGARATFSRVSLAERIYGRLRTEAAAAMLPDWAPASALGPDGRRLFRYASGRPLTAGVPGLFTASGYRDVLQRDLPDATRQAAGESWVLGHAEQVPTEGPQVAALETGVERLYAAEFIKRWDALLGDLALAPLNGQTEAVRDLYVLSSPQSPMRELLGAITRELQIAPPPPKPAGTGQAQPAPPPPSPAADEVGAHFRQLLDLDGGNDGGPLGSILRVVNSLQAEIAAAAPDGAPSSAGLQASGDPAQLLLAEAERQPAPVSAWLREISASGSTVLGSSTRAAATAAFAAADGPQAACHALVDGHYPFEADAQADAPIDDFARLFGPGGQFDTYFQRQIRPFVDTRGSVWTPHALGGVPAPISAAAAAGFQRVAAIRDAFFPFAGAPQVSFSLAPSAGSDPGATLTIGGTTVSKDPNQAASFNWPGSGGLSAASLTFDDQAAQQQQTNPLAGLATAAAAAPQAASGLQASGPWALFRLFDRGRLTATKGSSTTFTLSFGVSGRQASYVLQAGSTRNPFARNVLRGFKCPVVR